MNLKVLNTLILFLFLVTFANARNLHDSRDGHVYKTVKIGNQIWMAEDLKLNGKELYTWKEAKKACPANWHLPSEKEWKELIEYAGGGENAETNLKSKEGWGYTCEVRELYTECIFNEECHDEDGNPIVNEDCEDCSEYTKGFEGIDLYGFNVQANIGSGALNPCGAGWYAGFWSSTRDGDDVFVVAFNNNNSTEPLYWSGSPNPVNDEDYYVIDDHFAIRCLMGPAPK